MSLQAILQGHIPNSNLNKGKRRWVDEDEEIRLLKKELLKQQLENEKLRYEEMRENIDRMIVQRRKDAAIAEYFEIKNAPPPRDDEEVDGLIYQNL